MPLTPQQFEQFKNKLREIALQHPEQFLNLPGINQRDLFICIERKSGRSYSQISIKMDIPRSTVQDICRKCEHPPQSLTKKKGTV